LNNTDTLFSIVLHLYRTSGSHTYGYNKNDMGAAFSKILMWINRFILYGLLRIVVKDLPKGIPVGPWRRDEAFPFAESNIIWRPVEGSEIDGAGWSEGEIDLEIWNRNNGTATGCWYDSPENCETMYDFYPHCSEWMESIIAGGGWAWGPRYVFHLNPPP
jgi:hypothetical protein